MLEEDGRAPRSLTVASYLSEWLTDSGVTHVFELVGGMVTVLLDAFHSNKALTVTSVHHEQGAGFMAEGFSRRSGRPAVALATSGPGATNLLTAIGSCYFDSVSALFITGQVNTHEFRDGNGRQGGFQETDVVAMAQPVTKFAYLVRSPEEIPEVLTRALNEATTGRPGPVLIDIPMNIQRSPMTRVRWPTLAVEPETIPDDHRGAFLNRLASALTVSEKPLVLAGGGIRTAGVVGPFRDLIDTWQIPVVTSLLGKDAIAGTSPLAVGFIGSYGNRWANWAVSQSDLLLVLGSRLDVRQTGSDREGFRANRTIFHVDIDPTELNNHIRDCDILVDNIELFTNAAQEMSIPKRESWAEWLGIIQEMRVRWPDTSENHPRRGPNPNTVMKHIQSKWPSVTTFVTDVGQHQMWAAQSLVLRPDQRFLTSGGMGSMGFGLPAAIGAALAADSELVCLIAGDGGFQCNIQELQTLVRLQANVRIVVLDNGCHGMVRQFQESYFGGRFHSTRWGYSAPEFCEVATAYGIPASHVEDHGELQRELSRSAFTSGPFLIHVMIDGDVNAYPKMSFGQPFGSMEPAVMSVDMEGT